MVTILILYTELMPYNVVVIRELVKKKCRVHVVLQDTDKKTPYLPPLLEGVTYIIVDILVAGSFISFGKKSGTRFGLDSRLDRSFV